MSRLMYISNLGKQIQYIEKAVATYPELLQRGGRRLQHEKTASLGWGF